MRKRTPRHCKACGTQFFAEPGRRPALCMVCRLKADLDCKGVERDSTRAALAEAELMRQGNGRICHDCKRPTPDYRCPDCWAKRRKKASPSAQFDHEGESLTDGEYLYA